MNYILHVDGDNFFASCLAAKNPKYKNKPLVVGEERGMVIALSQEAKALGIKRGDPLFKLREQFKDNELIILAGDYEYFGKVSYKMHSIIEGFTANIEKYSIDESFADITDVVLKRNSTPEIIGCEIKEKIQVSLGINVSVGISSTKTLAKLTSTSSKPNGFKVAQNLSEIDDILSKTEIHKVWNIGSKTAVKLRVWGLYTAKDLRDAPSNIISQFGKPVRDIQNELKGIIVNNIKRTHALEHTMTSSQSFKSTNDIRFIKSEFARHIYEISNRLRTNNAAANQLTIYTRNKNLETKSITHTFLKHTESPSIFLEEFDLMLPLIWDEKELLKTTGAYVENIIPSEFVTNSLFDKRENLEKDILNKIENLNKKGVKVFTARLLK